MIPCIMNKTIVSISRFGPLRATFRGLFLHRLYNKWLEHFPRTRVLPNSGVTYRSRRTEAVSLALEILEGGNCYDTSLLPDDCSTFSDLGCNIGYFACLLADHSKKPIRGIMVDANPEVLKEARWHVQTNKWEKVDVLQGVVGVSSPDDSAEFLVHEANTVSTAQLTGSQLKHENQYQKIKTPIISLGKEWSQRMGKVRCNLLKIDIEGCELVFFQQETQFLELVDAIFVECHEYRVPFDDLKSYLTSKGFSLVKIVEVAGLNVTAFFKRADAVKSATGNHSVASHAT
jgi:FkbM family methyltransferase